MMDVGRSLAGSVLVATPLITEPPFWRTVVAVLEHDEEGALGLIVNLPSDLGVDHYLPEAKDALAPPPVIFIGGPVGSDSALGMLEGHEAMGIRESHFSGVSIVDPTAQDLPEGRMRVFAGFSGWSPGQLETELNEGGWWSALGRSEDFFTPDPGSLWESTVRRIRGRARLYATFPDDPASN